MSVEGFEGARPRVLTVAERVALFQKLRAQVRRKTSESRNRDRATNDAAVSNDWTCALACSISGVRQQVVR